MTSEPTLLRLVTLAVAAFGKVAARLGPWRCHHSAACRHEINRSKAPGIDNVSNRSRFFSHHILWYLNIENTRYGGLNFSYALLVSITVYEQNCFSHRTSP